MRDQLYAKRCAARSGLLARLGARVSMREAFAYGRLPHSNTAFPLPARVSLALTTAHYVSAAGRFLIATYAARGAR
jgi:hypothetical protein